jgi:prepilin-type processing-associated H-X9-DG protein
MRRTHTLDAITVVMCLVCLAALAGMLLPALLSRPRSGRRISCLSYVKQIGLALEQYAQDFDDTYPWHTTVVVGPDEAWRSLGFIYPNYNSGFRSFFCPQSRDKPYRLTKDPFDLFPFRDSSHTISYAYGIDARDPANPRPWTTNAPSTVRLLADKKAGVALTERSAHGGNGRNVFYNDGHVKWAAGGGPLDPDEDDGTIGSPTAADCTDWWSDPPYYGEDP